jgi:pyridoxine 5-phosphate synthase
MSIALSINLNKIALIRNSRAGDFPSVTEHASRILAAGADGLTIHPRPDQRHIRACDAAPLAAVAARAGVELNIEGNPLAGPARSTRADVSDYPGFMALVREIRPTQCTLVPDSDAQLTSDHGFDLLKGGARLAPLIEELRDLGIRVSLFMDPDPEQVRAAARLGAHRIELYTGPYARDFAAGESTVRILGPYAVAARAALEAGLGVNAGHDLNLHNLPAFCSVPGLAEVSIGHAFTVDALSMGLGAAVRAYQRSLGKPA